MTAQRICARLPRLIVTRLRPKSSVTSPHQPVWIRPSPWPTPFSPTCFPRFPSGAAPCCGAADHPTPNRTPPTCSNYARRCCRAAARLPAPRWRARCSTAIITSTRPAGSPSSQTLARDYGPDREKLSQAIETWRAQPSDDDASDLHFASEPRRQELIRRLNRAPGGTSDLVAMRADLLGVMTRTTRISPRSTATSCICCRHGSTGDFSCCAGLTGRAPPTSWKRSSATRRCMKSATGTICAAASIRSTGAVTRSSIPHWSTNR